MEDTQSAQASRGPTLRVGIDIGGTFTDFVIHDSQSQTIESFKLLSTPHNPAEVVLDGLARIAKSHGKRPLHVVHGSTVATNALLERKGARTAFIATQGFKDILQIGRQNRPELYNLQADPPPVLVDSGLRFEVNERIDQWGAVLQAFGQREVDNLLASLKETDAASVAVCLLFSFANPTHEQRIGESLRQAGYFVSLSSEILPEYREYERASTTAVNAYVSPVLDGYLSHLEQRLGEKEELRLRVMQSNGGNISLAEARRYGVRCILSGPAGGIIGAQFTAKLGHLRAGQPVDVITFDMGGTSTDVSLITDAPQITTEAVIGGCPIRIPVLDIHTIGAGGGSIARLDMGGALRVGPHSAGADPGPACYGKGELPTVTDANLVLGRLLPDTFLGGQMLLDASRAYQAFSRLGQEMGMTAIQAALGVVAVANVHMERALRVISVERGHDPRGFRLLSFGGAGGLHAADLARRLGIPQVIVPPLASTLSAFGMLAADVIRDYTLTVMLPGNTPINEIGRRLDKLAESGRRDVQTEGVPEQDIRLEAYLDLRYQGQSYELIVPFSEAFLTAFHALHEQVYGYARPQAAVEIVNLRLKALGRTPQPDIQHQPWVSETPDQAWLSTRPVVFESGELPTPFYSAERLQSGNRLAGPAVVVRSDTTILIGPNDWAEVDGFGNLLIQVEAEAQQ